MSKIFVSYSRRDSALVQKVVDQLMERGVPIWQDKLGKRAGIPFSQKWMQSIEVAITRALGMVIFLSDHWEQSKVCHAEKEYALAEGIPLLKIDLRESRSDDAIVQTILAWYDDDIKNNKHNHARADLYGSMNSFLNNPRYARKYPGVILLAQYLVIYSARMERFCQLPQVRQKWNKYIRAIIWRAVRIVVFAILLAGLVYGAAVLGGKTAGGILGLGSNLASEFNIAHSAVPLADFLPYMPYQALEHIAANTAVLGYENSIANVHRLLALNVPVQITEKPKQADHLPANQQHPRYEVALSDDTGTVQVYDNELSRSRTLVLSSAPSLIAWREDGQVLAIANNEKVHVWDTRLFEGQPAVLDGNIHTVEDLWWKDNTIVVRLGSGQECTWNNPIPGPIFTHNLQTGRVVDTIAGPIAVYVAENRLYVQAGGQERVLPIQSGETISSYFLDVSPDGEYVAVGLGGASSWNRLAIVSLADGNILFDVIINVDCLDLRFVDEGKKVLLSGGFSQGVFLYDLQKKTLINTPVPDQSITSVCETAQGYAAGSYLGNIHFFDKNLNLLEKMLIRPSAGAVRQMVPAGDYLFFSSDVGNKYLGSARVNTLEKGLKYIQRPPMVDTLATTAVATDSTGNFAAFSYPNGEVWAYTTGSLCVLGGWDDLSEKIVHLCFSVDSSSIYALGRSGTIYHLHPQVPFVGMTESDAVLSHVVRDYWYTLMNQAAHFHAKGYANGLTTVGSQAFYDSIPGPDATLNPDIVMTE